MAVTANSQFKILLNMETDDSNRCLKTPLLGEKMGFLIHVKSLLA